MDPESEYIGPYEKIRRLGVGAAAEVWLCRGEDGERAIKVLREGEANSGGPESLERFEREARAAAEFQHDRIVRTYSADVTVDPPYIVMEYVQGGSVRDLIDAGDPISPDRIVEIAIDAATGLAAAHKQGIVHRDVKPGNLLVESNGRVKVADLGLARLSSVCEQTLTNSGIMIGTPYYVSPEQASDAKRATNSSDVYSLGATLFHLATGRPVYKEASSIQTVMCHVNSPPVDPREFRPDLPAGLSAVINKALEKDPRFRYADMDEMLDDLKLLQEHGADYQMLRADVLTHTNTASDTGESGRHNRLMVAAIVTGIAAAVAAYLLT
jgi:serine/threonine-protein kinase